MTILETSGLRVLDPEARRIFRRGGFEIDDDAQQVRLDRAGVLEQVAKAPDRTSVRGRNPERRVRPVYAAGNNFGVIDFVFGDSPRLVFQLVDSAGRSVWKPLELHAGELVNGVVCPTASRGAATGG